MAIEFFPEPRLDNLAQYIKKNNVEAEILDLNVPMKTSNLAAEQLKTDLHHIFKSLVLQGPKKDDLIIVVLPGDYHINMDSISQHTGWKKSKISFARPDVVIEKTGYPGGGTPPFGHRYKLPVIMDESMLSVKEGFGGGGRYEYMVRVTPHEIIRVTNARVLAISNESVNNRANNFSKTELLN